MRLSDAFAILQRDKGNHFDPEVVDTFTRFYEKEGGLLDASYHEAIQSEDPSYVSHQKPIPTNNKTPQEPRKRGMPATGLNPAGT